MHKIALFLFLMFFFLGRECVQRCRGCQDRRRHSLRCPRHCIQPPHTQLVSLKLCHTHLVIRQLDILNPRHAYQVILQPRHP